MKLVVQNTATKLSSDFIITYKGGDIGESCRLMRRSLLYAAILLCVFAFDVVSVAFVADF